MLLDKAISDNELALRNDLTDLIYRIDKIAKLLEGDSMVLAAYELGDMCGTIRTIRDCYTKAENLIASEDGE